MVLLFVIFVVDGRESGSACNVMDAVPLEENGLITSHR